MSAILASVYRINRGPDKGRYAARIYIGDISKQQAIIQADKVGGVFVSGTTKSENKAVIRVIFDSHIANPEAAEELAKRVVASINRLDRQPPTIGDGARTLIASAAGATIMVQLTGLAQQLAATEPGCRITLTVECGGARFCDTVASPIP